MAIQDATLRRAFAHPGRFLSGFFFLDRLAGRFFFGLLMAAGSGLDRTSSPAPWEVFSLLFGLSDAVVMARGGSQEGEKVRSIVGYGDPWNLL